MSSERMTSKEWADKYGYDLTRLAQLSPRILEFTQAYGDYSFAHGERTGYEAAIASERRRCAEIAEGWKAEFAGRKEATGIGVLSVIEVLRRVADAILKGED